MYHLSTKPISRSSGRSAVASIAYRAGIEITDERTGRKFDYTKRTGVLATNLITPNNLSISRSDLWNMAELVETRKNSRTARETVIHIPHELMQGDGTAGKQLAFDFGKHLSDKYGIAVDVAVHAPDRHGDQRNYHAHILMTTRQLERAADGSVTLAKKSQFEMSNTQLKAAGLLSCQDELKEIRETWANYANKALAEHNIDKRIDHRSHKDRGLQELPTIKLGWKATELERQGIRTAAGDYNRAVKEYNNTLKEIGQTKAAIKQNAINERIKPLERAKADAATQVPPQPTKSTVSENKAVSDTQKPAAKPTTPKITAPTQPAEPVFDYKKWVDELDDVRVTVPADFSKHQKSQIWRYAMQKGVVIDGYTPTHKDLADAKRNASGKMMNLYAAYADTESIEISQNKVQSLTEQLEKLKQNEPQGLWAKLTFKHSDWAASVSQMEFDLRLAKENLEDKQSYRKANIADAKNNTQQRLERAAAPPAPKLTHKQEFEQLKAKLPANDKVKVEAIRQVIEYQYAGDAKSLQAGYDKLNTAIKNGAISKLDDAPQQVVQQEIEVKLAKSQDKDRGR